MANKSGELWSSWRSDVVKLKNNLSFKTLEAIQCSYEPKHKTTSVFYAQ